MVEPGHTVPDFELKGVAPDGEIRLYTLADLTAEKPLVVGVYPYDFSPVCTEQICEMDDIDLFTINRNVNVVGLSGDGPWSHRKFSEEKDIDYPLLADTDEQVIDALGVYRNHPDEPQPITQRSLFLVDTDRTVRYKWVAEDNWDDWGVAPVSELKEELDGILEESPA